MTRKTSDVHFINDQVLNRYFQRPIRLPIKIIVYKTAKLQALDAALGELPVPAEGSGVPPVFPAVVPVAPFGSVF